MHHFDQLRPNSASPSGPSASDNAFHLLDQIRRKAGFVDQRLIIRTFIEPHPEATHHLVEDAANGSAIYEDLQLPWVDTQAYDELGRRVQAVRADSFGEKRWLAVTGLVKIPVAGQGSKLDRLTRVSPIVSDGRVLLPSWWEPTDEPRYPGDKGDQMDVKAAWAGLINECSEIPNATNDDQADTLSQALAWGNGHIVTGVSNEVDGVPKARRMRRSQRR